ncbi:MAG TPA: tRNA (adenosine(37)-N6)-threonylcarbamoyltransferase complex ATPase subunit type 1 TsaE [Saprospiraceae bacterium]|nr:tRNA (adenosine(37)-N6)-threonylcarbamoyltransferase complex ATPase subunit type 1 TsaE [Saprospiraceae bacterium]
MKKEWIFKLEDIDNITTEIALSLEEGTKIFLIGPMAAGKTTLTKSLVASLGSKDAVTSPTYSLVNEYKLEKAAFLIKHIDLYRLNSIEEALDIDIEDHLYDSSICIIEWPEIIEPLAPENVLRLILSVLPNNQRKLVFL